jgi:hypothetical protein
MISAKAKRMSPEIKAYFCLEGVKSEDREFECAVVPSVKRAGILRMKQKASELDVRPNVRC